MQLVVRYSHVPLFVRRCMARLLSEQQLNPCCIARTITPHHCPQVLVDNVVREMVRSVRTFPARQLMMIRQVGCPRARRQLGQLTFRVFLQLPRGQASVQYDQPLAILQRMAIVPFFFCLFHTDVRLCPTTTQGRNAHDC